MTMQDWIDTLDDSKSKYVAVEGDRPSRTRLPYLKYIKPAFDRGIRVHGFAMVKQNAIGTYPFYSVDSTSWKAGSQYGVSLSFDGKEFNAVRYKDKHENIFKLSGVVDNITDINSESKRTQREKREEIAVKAYLQMEDYYTELWKKKGVVWQ